MIKMILHNSASKAAILLVVLLAGTVATGQGVESVTYEGDLKVGARESTIVYLGAETGDLAAFCFTNKSAVGRAILAKCKNGGRCKFTGRVDFQKACRIKGDFSATARIVSVRSVRRFNN